MKVNKFNSVWIILLAFTYSPQIYAGSATSGGGGTHTCLNADGTIKSTELYDLYEGREARGFTIIDPGSKNANEILNTAVKKIYDASPRFARDLIIYFEFYTKNKVIVYDKQLAIVNDANIIFLDKGCLYQQVAQWRDEYEKIFIDGNLYNEFKKSPLNIAALALHEVIYAYSRSGSILGSGPQTDSDLARKLVSEILSNEKFKYSDEYVFPNVYELVPTKKSRKLRLRFSANQNTANTYLDGPSKPCIVRPGNPCIFPLKLTNGAKYFRYSVDTLGEGISRNNFTGKVEILEDDIPIYTYDIDLAKKEQMSKNIRLALSYEDAMEPYILSLSL